MKVFITGINGFLGHHIAAEFLEAGCTVAGVDRDAAILPDLHGKAGYRKMFLPDEAVTECIGGFSPDVSVHCAGGSSVAASITDPRGDFVSSVAMTEQLLAALRKATPKCRTIFLSSAAVYGQPADLPVTEDDPIRPLSPYGYHKRICELLFEKAALLDGLPTASLRIFSAYGPGLKRQVLWEMVSQLAQEKPLRLKGTGDETRDFIHATDVARAVRIVAEKAPAKGEVYNVATGTEISIRQAAELLCSHFPRAEAPQFAGQSIKGDPQRWRADCAKLIGLGYATTLPLNQGIASLARWAKGEQAYPPLKK